MGLLRLNVLGPPEVFHDGNRLSFALRKAQALLLYLAVEGGMHQRRQLDAFLWPDSEPYEARAALRNAIALLRRLLADPEASPSHHTHLLSLHDLLSLDPHAPVELDLDAVLHAWKEAHKLSMLPSEEHHAALVTLVQRALALVRGPFLDGFWLGEDAPFDAWREQQQRQWRVRYPDLPAPTEDELTAKGRLFEAVARLLDALCQRAPLLLLVDDLQWADEASLDLLRYLGHSWKDQGSRVLLLGTGRGEELELNPQLSTQLVKLGR